MLTFTKKPIEVEAMHYAKPLDCHAIHQWMSRPHGNELMCGGGAPITIHTRDGVMEAELGDWIIKEPFPTGDRAFYPCKPDIFEQTYVAGRVESAAVCDRLRKALAFARSAIKSGEAWTDTCDEIIDGALNMKVAQGEAVARLTPAEVEEVAEVLQAAQGFVRRARDLRAKQSPVEVSLERIVNTVNIPVLRKKLRGQNPTPASMLNAEDWETFRKAGLLWWVNRQLHLFGWALVFEVPGGQPDAAPTHVYPARCKFRGFGGDSEDRGFKHLTGHIRDSMPDLLRDAEVDVVEVEVDDPPDAR